MLDAAGDADELLGLVVVRRDVFVGNRPIGAEPVESVGMKIIIGEAEGKAAVVLRASAYDARSEPFEFRTGCDGVRLAVELPAAGGRREIAETPAAAAEVALRGLADAAVVHLVRPHVLFEILRGIDHRTGFEECDGDAEVGEDLGDGSAPGAGADNDDVVNRTALEDLHGYGFSVAQVS